MQNYRTITYSPDTLKQPEDLAQPLVPGVAQATEMVRASTARVLESSDEMRPGAALVEQARGVRNVMSGAGLLRRVGQSALLSAVLAMGCTAPETRPVTQEVAVSAPAGSEPNPWWSQLGWYMKYYGLGLAATYLLLQTTLKYTPADQNALGQNILTGSLRVLGSGVSFRGPHIFPVYPDPDAGWREKLRSWVTHDWNVYTTEQPVPSVSIDGKPAGSFSETDFLFKDEAELPEVAGATAGVRTPFKITWGVAAHIVSQREGQRGTLDQAYQQYGFGPHSKEAMRAACAAVAHVAVTGVVQNRDTATVWDNAGLLEEINGQPGWENLPAGRVITQPHPAIVNFFRQTGIVIRVREIKIDQSDAVKKAAEDVVAAEGKSRAQLAARPGIEAEGAAAAQVLQARGRAQADVVREVGGAAEAVAVPIAWKLSQVLRGHDPTTPVTPDFDDDVTQPNINVPSGTGSNP